MLKSSRNELIISILKEKKIVTTKELEKILKVSGTTIRKDLDFLEAQGSLQRIHGGAKYVQKEEFKNDLIDFHVRSKKNIEEKKAICKSASKLINNGINIFIDASSTVLYIFRYLQDRDGVTIITNGLYTALEAKENDKFNVIVIGGMIRSKSGALESLLGDCMVERLNADYMFTSAYGFSLEKGLTDFNFYEVELKRKMKGKAKKLVALLDHTKMNKESAAQFAKTNEIDIIITDSGTDVEYIKKIQSIGIEVIVAEWIFNINKKCELTRIENCFKNEIIVALFLLFFRE